MGVFNNINPQQIWEGEHSKTNQLQGNSIRNKGILGFNNNNRHLYTIHIHIVNL